MKTSPLVINTVSQRFFVKVIDHYWNEYRSELRNRYKKALKIKKTPYWLWDQFLVSMCTMGGSANWPIKEKQFKHCLHWLQLSRLSVLQRKKIFQELPNPRWQKRASLFLEKTFQKIQKMGGPKKVANAYDLEKTPRDKISFLKKFPGIGDKYSRNIAMSIADPSFVKHIALDHRINELAKLIVGYPFQDSYRVKEQYLLGVLNRSKVPDAWYFDRLLYWHYEDIKMTLISKKIAFKFR